MFSLGTFLFAAGFQGVSPLSTPSKSQSAHIAGVAFDSLSSRPLASALVGLVGTDRIVLTDSAGRFSFDSVTLGPSELVLQHEVLDSLGFGEIRTKLQIDSGINHVSLFIPTFAAIWRNMCGGRPPVDSGFVYGTVRFPGGQPASEARITAIWNDVAFAAATGIRSERLGGTVTADSRGQFVMCGVPIGVQLDLRASIGTSVTEWISIPHGAPGATRRNLVLARGADTTLVGAVRGRVQSGAGAPLPNARVRIEGALEQVTDDSGSFLLTGVRVGTRSISVRAIGAHPSTAAIDVMPGDTVRIAITSHSVPTVDTVRVSGSVVQERFLAEFEIRRELGIAKFVDSTTLTRLGSTVSAILSRSTSRVDRTGELYLGPSQGILPGCKPHIWIDRRLLRQEDNSIELRLINPSEIAAIEVYERRTMIPTEFYPRSGLPNCAIVIWTKRMFP